MDEVQYKQDDINNYPAMLWPTSLDIPLKASEEVVSIDLETDLPSDPNDLKTLLIEENSDREHWLTIAIAYCNQNKILEGIKLGELALENFNNDDFEKSAINTFLTWAYLKLSNSNYLNSIDEKNSYLLKAEDYLKNSISLNPKSIPNMLATIDLYYLRGNYDKALETIDLFTKSINNNKNDQNLKQNSMFILIRAKILYQKKQYLPSLKLFQQLLIINPSLDPDPRIGIGLCFWQLKDYNMAKKSWKRALNLCPKNKIASILLLLSDLHFTLSDSKNDQNFIDNYTNFLKNLNNIYSSFNDNNEIVNPVLLVLLQSYYFLKNDYNKVLDIYNNNVQKLTFKTSSSVISDSLFWCGRAYYSLNDYRNAFQMFSNSLKLNEENLLSKFGIGQTQIKNNLLEESMLTFENLYKSNENIQELNYILGLLYATKSLKLKNEKHLSSSELTNLINKSINYFEKYIKITLANKNQLINIKAYLMLSELYEIQNQYKSSLDYLLKAIEQYKFQETEENDNAIIPLEILNNIACFYFISNDFEKAESFFEQAQNNFESNKSIYDDNYDITLKYNIARTLELKDEFSDKPSSLYNDILKVKPDYVYAKIRSIFHKFSKSNNNFTEFDNVFENLIEEHSSNLELRSLFSWYIKERVTHTSHTDENIKKWEELENQHNKSTLTKYDSHDGYALLSLGNLYLLLGLNNVKEKSKTYFLKCIQLFQKVLQFDPLNVFAAQGLAICFAQNKRLGPALEIFRKIRDSLDNQDIHMNIGHSLLEMNEYAKAIETYEFILKKFHGDEEKSDKKLLSSLYNTLGRAWYSRGSKENKLLFFKNALDCVTKSLNYSEGERNEKILTLKFNVVLIRFQIAEILRRSSVRDKTSADIKDGIEGLNEANIILEALIKDENFKYVTKEELEQRIQLSKTTMKSSLERLLKEQVAFEDEQLKKVQNAKFLQEQHLKQEELENKKAEEERLEKLAKQEEEYKKLQDEAQKFIQERGTIVDEEDVANVSDDEDYNKPDEKATKKRKRKASTKEKKESEDNNDDDDEIIPKAKRGKKSTLSNEIIEDSDEEFDESVKDATLNDDNDDDDGDNNDNLF